MNHVGLEVAQQLEDAWVQGDGVAGLFVQLDEAHAGLGDAVPEIADGGEREHHVFKLVGRQAVDELHDDVLEPAHGEAVHHVDDAPAAWCGAHAGVAIAGAAATGDIWTGACAWRRNASNMINIHSAVEWSNCRLRCWSTSVRRVSALK